MKKTVFITGVGQGLGKALFDDCVERGFRTYGILRNLDQYKSSLKNLDEERAHLILADVGKEECIDKVRKTVQREKIDLLINNAGLHGSNSSLKECESKEIWDAFNVHCLGAFRMVKALESNLLLESPATIINISSRLSSLRRQNYGDFRNSTETYAYPIAKAAQNMLTVRLRQEFQGELKVIALHPGKLKTQQAPPDADLAPEQAAQQLLDSWLAGHFVEEDGIWDLQNGLIPW